MLEAQCIYFLPFLKAKKLPGLCQYLNTKTLQGRRWEQWGIIWPLHSQAVLLVWGWIYPGPKKRKNEIGTFLAPLKRAHPAGPVTFTKMSISSIDYMYLAEPGSFHLPASPVAIPTPHSYFLAFSPPSPHCPTMQSHGVWATQLGKNWF